jgi:hypothetical protein
LDDPLPNGYADRPRLIGELGITWTDS